MRFFHAHSTLSARASCSAIEATPKGVASWRRVSCIVAGRFLPSTWPCCCPSSTWPRIAAAPPPGAGRFLPSTWPCRCPSSTWPRIAGSSSTWRRPLPPFHLALPLPLFHLAADRRQLLHLAPAAAALPPGQPGQLAKPSERARLKVSKIIYIYLRVSAPVAALKNFFPP